MRVVCDNCAATYKIPEHKLVREVNKATCRRCGHGIIIRKSGAGYQSVAPSPDAESTQITSQEEIEARARAQAQAHASGSYSTFGFDEEEHSEDIPPTVIDPPGDETVPRPGLAEKHQKPPANPTLAPPPPPPPPLPAPKPTTKAPPPTTASAGPSGVPIKELAPQGHDPSGDMALVMMCSLGAMAGASLMAVTSDHALEVIGLAIALASSITSLLVLATGSRGRKEASIVLSMFLGLFLAGGAAAAVKFTGIGFEAGEVQLTEGPEEKVTLGGTEIPEGAFNDAVAADEADEPTIEDRADALAAALAEMEKAEDQDSADGITELDEPEEDAPTVTAPKTTVKRKTAADVAPKSSSKSSGSTKSSSGSTKSSSGSTKSSGSSTKSTSAASSGNVGVPVTVLDTMLKSNKGVKRCFGLYRQETGSLPSGRITVKLAIQPSGRASSARIDGGQYSGTSLDSCLGSAITQITFPPWEGSEAATYYYPFIL